MNEGEKAGNTEHSQNADKLAQIKYNLTRADRRLLAFFLGYLDDEKSGKKAEKKREDSCLFVKKSLFCESEEREKEAFNIESEIDWNGFKKTPGVFTKQQTDVERFLRKAGRGSTDVQECAYVRGFQAFSRVYAEQTVVKSSGYLLLCLLGKVCTNKKTKEHSYLYKASTRNGHRGGLMVVDTWLRRWHRSMKRS